MLADTFLSISFKNDRVIETSADDKNWKKKFVPNLIPLWMGSYSKWSL